MTVKHTKIYTFKTLRNITKVVVKCIYSVLYNIYSIILCNLLYNNVASVD